MEKLITSPIYRPVAPGAKAPRITNQNLSTLKGATSKVIKRNKSIFQLIGDQVSSFLGEIALAMAPKAENKMCKYYGHVFQQKDWNGYLPKCSDCGCEITSPNQLRKSDPSCGSTLNVGLSL